MFHPLRWFHWLEGAGGRQQQPQEESISRGQCWVSAEVRVNQAIMLIPEIVGSLMDHEVWISRNVRNMKLCCLLSRLIPEAHVVKAFNTLSAWSLQNGPSDANRQVLNASACDVLFQVRFIRKLSFGWKVYLTLIKTLKSITKGVFLLLFRNASFFLMVTFVILELNYSALLVKLFFQLHILQFSDVFTQRGVDQQVQNNSLFQKGQHFSPNYIINSFWSFDQTKS